MSAGAEVRARDAGAAVPTDEQLRQTRERQQADAQARDLIRGNAELFYGADCPGLTIPDAAFQPVELDGIEATREIAVTFGRAQCGDHKQNIFTGTGGVMIQFWQIVGNRPHLLLEQSMHGFTGQAPYLVTMQHGGACPGGAGPSPCRIIYRWDPLGRRLETESRQLLDDGWVLHNYGSLTGVPGCLRKPRRGVCH